MYKSEDLLTLNRSRETTTKLGKYSKTTGGTLPTIPSSLPNEAKGENVLKTLKVE